MKVRIYNGKIERVPNGARVITADINDEAAVTKLIENMNFDVVLGYKSNTVVFDNSKIKRLVPDFIATTRFDQGVKLSIENILSHPELQLEDSEFDLFCEKVISAQTQAVTYFKNL
ncbi:MAG: hypothetical protein MUO60_01015 [Clostridiaceae bacterium]|nr:hypothetical protein [Clostridiaceae bacterium]